MTEHWSWSTPIGTFHIVRYQGRYQLRFGDEQLGTYASELQALDDLVGGHCFWPSSGIDPATLGIPDDLSVWERRR